MFTAPWSPLTDFDEAGFTLADRYINIIIIYKIILYNKSLVVSCSDFPSKYWKMRHCDTVALERFKYVQKAIKHSATSQGELCIFITNN
jgi:hypothetical protein